MSLVGTLIGIVLLLVIVGVLLWGGQRLLALVPMPEWLRTVIVVLGAIGIPVRFPSFR